MKSIIKLIRVYQWIKSGFIFLPFIFSSNLQQFFKNPSSPAVVSDIQNLLIAFFGFSFLASFGYVLNDWRDVELDRADERKKQRPLASGAIQPIVGLAIALVLFAMALALSTLLSSVVTVIFVIYALVNIFFYSFLGKRIILLDVFIIAIGFVLRVQVGASALDISASPWLISVTFFLALFLGFSKRFFEVQSGPREVLMGGVYNEQSLQHFISISAALALMNYAMYCIIGTHAAAQLYWTIPLVVLGIFRYYVLTHGPVLTRDGNPSDVLLSDKFLILIILFWVITCGSLIIYFENGL